MPSEKQRLKRKAKSKEANKKKVARKRLISEKVKEAKNKYQQIKEQRRAEVQVISYIFKAINGRLPEENESIDTLELKDLLKKFLKKKPDVPYYDEIAKFAEKKIKQIDQILEQEKKLRKLTKKKA